MSVNLNKFTQKAQEAIFAAQRLAEDNLHSQIEPLHLFSALLSQADGVVPQIVNRIGLSLGPLREKVSEIVHRLAERQMTLTLSPRASAFLAREGYDPAYRARPLKRTLQRLGSDLLAKAILEGEFVEGDHLAVDLDDKNEKIAFRHGLEVIDGEVVQ